MSKIYLNFVLAIEAAVIINNNHDYFAYIDNRSHFCKSFYYMIVEKKISKFGSANYINVLSYWKYSNVFSDLTFVKKIFVICPYLIMSIIKLRFSKTGLSIFYY